MEVDLVPYAEGYRDQWDSFCENAVNSTFLHTRLFLSYHGDRFKDESLLLFQEGRLVGVFPAARYPGDPSVVVSHPGVTFGGLVHDGWLTGERMVVAIGKVVAFYQAQGFEKLVYKAIPHGYALIPSEDDIYALFRNKASIERCNLSCAIDLSSQRPLGERRRRALKKAVKRVALSNGSHHLSRLWEIVGDNLQRKHSAQPVHSESEMGELLRRFPDSIELRCAAVNGIVEAGVVLFKSRRLWHAQYIASSDVGYETSALDAVFSSAIEDARTAGMRYFDFGTSNEDGGRRLNEGLYRFKSEFGGGGMAHQFFQIGL